MTKTSTLLLPFDFSKAARNALNYAMDYVGIRGDMTIRLLYTHDGADTQRVEKDFLALRESFDKKKGALLQWTLEKGPLNEAILKVQDSYKAALIVMGTSGRESAEEGGSHTSRLVLEADCPVLVVPESTKEFRLQHLALVLGREPIEDPAVLNTLLGVVRRFDAQVHVLTIQNEEGLYGYSETDEKNEKLLKYYLESFYADHMYLENTDLVAGITEFAKDKELDVIAILPRNHLKKGSPSEGKLTEVLALHGGFPLLTLD